MDEGGWCGREEKEGGGKLGSKAGMGKMGMRGVNK